MNLQDCLAFARENPVCQLATVDGDQPHVRTVLLWFADESGFYFILLSPKQVCAQLTANPKAEVCFTRRAADLMSARQLRVAGRMELVSDPVLQQRALRERAFLSTLAGRPVDPYVQIFRLTDCDAHFWGMTDVLREPQLEHVRF